MIIISAHDLGVKIPELKKLGVDRILEIMTDSISEPVDLISQAVRK